jgi:hypothetical protein
LAASRPWDALRIERTHDLHRRAAFNVLRKDASHDTSLGLIDGALAALLAIAHNVVPVAAAAGNAPGFDAADLAALRLLRQVVEEQAAEQTLDGNEHLVHVTVRQGDDAYTPI